VAHGNSITRGAGASNDTLTSYPPVLQGLIDAAAPGSWSVVRKGFDGFDTEQLTANFMAQVHPFKGTGGARNVVVIHEGMNDIRHGATTQGAIDEMLNYCAQARSLGWEVWICTGTPQQFTTDVMASQAAYNAYVRAHWQDFGGKLVDLAADARLATPTNLTYYSGDGLHPNDAGYAVIASLVFAAGALP
jgi:lysophospholipase L1-like esterase